MIHTRGPSKYRFRFESPCVESPDCKEAVNGAWNGRVRESHMFEMVQKLELCKRYVMQWKKERFGYHTPMIDSLNAQLKQLQSVKPEQTNKRAEKAISNRIDDLLNQKEMYWQQQSRNNCLRLGDKNSRFFHASASHRKRRNWITKLKRDSDDLWAENPFEIKSLIEEHFTDIYALSGTREFEEVLCGVE